MKNKKTLAFIPAILLVLFLLNSFVLKDKETKDKPANETASSVLYVVFRSADGGQTWQNISEGLPQNLQREGVQNVFANNWGLFLRAGNAVYNTQPNSATAIWTKDVLPGKHPNLTPGQNGIFAYNFRGQFLKKTNGTPGWVPMYANFQEQAVRINRTVDWMYTHFKEKGVCAVFETTAGTVFISSNNSLFKSSNRGKTWRQVHAGDGTMKLTEADGVLLATNKEGILRSTDNGETWDRAINEGGPGISVERINGGFAAIVYNTITQTNTIHVSLDSGKTWNSIAEELQPSWNDALIQQLSGARYSISILSIKQLGKYLVCGRSDGIFRSPDMGKTWTKLVLPAVENKGFSLYVSDGLMYVMPNKGC